MKLPNEFIEKYQTILKDEAEAFFDSFEQKPISAYRTNPLKEKQLDFPNAIPSTPWGHYGKISGKSIEHTTGLVYSQEPAAQIVAQIAEPQEGMKVLDLAAAPGGKTTHLLSYLNNTGLLVSNEISNKRSKILVENVERFGARNVIVTNESSQRLAKCFNSFFDLIVFDGPCSGEGMFRKDPQAIQYWHKDYPTECAQLQRDILKEAIKMLAHGGILVYSTCTWSPEENEEVVNWLLQEYDYLELVDIPKLNGMVEGINVPQVARMYPHHFQGEGQFVAKLRDTRSKEAQKIKPKAQKINKMQLQLWQQFAQDHLKIDLNGVLDVFGDQLYLLPNGLHLGTFKKNRFEPSFALGMALSEHDLVQSIEIDIEQFEVYVSGNVVKLDKTVPNGWYQILVKGNGLGFAKVTNNTLKNYYPKGLRFQT
ncbi:TPA: RsmF rRNA methyltransferase first C-terminal domain-containing protein [Streptococcus agalactiae]|nr:RsmF rRNA methyltransferase first C-terminal domain-containing protein [Streptococcus agalactiae]HEO7486492.1 RsmF rRNA methyltransferase first C-terminal domain-containing protein [Streptococcus agalactiae]HEO7488313.1 RsmF rRNA methyltransferase first C-terminal domain-containing protein [Streptococcus agalactiae]